MTQPPPIIPGAPPTPPAYYPPQPTPPKPPSTGFPAWAFITLVAVACLTAGGCFYGFLTIAGRDSGSNVQGATVNVSDCTTSSGFYKATVSIKNDRTRSASYRVSVEWYSSSTRLATDVAYFNNLGAGQEAMTSAIGTGTKWTGPVSCRFTVR